MNVKKTRCGLIPLSHGVAARPELIIHIMYNTSYLSKTFFDVKSVVSKILRGRGRRNEEGEKGTGGRVFGFFRETKAEE